MYKVYQIKLAREVTDFVNSNDRGHTGAEEKYPEYEAHMRLMHGRGDDYAAKFTSTDFQHFTKVCDVKKDAGLLDGDGDKWVVDCLEGVFAVLNGRYINEETYKSSS